MTDEAPRLLKRLEGHETAQAEWSDAMKSGRMHHGWLLQGPRGIGKAHLALRMAAGALGVPPGEVTHPVADLIAAGSHPDLRIVRIPVDEKGKRKSDIPVDSIRELSRFFNMSPAMGGWRIAIIDALGDLNRNGANALLKTLEEPPARCLLLLVSHDGGSVLPTIRSRCRVLRLSPLNEEQATAVMNANGVSGADAKEALDLAPGRPGLALVLSSQEGLEAAKAARSVARSLRSLSIAPMRDLVKAASKSEVGFDAALTVLTRDLMDRARGETGAGPAGQMAAQAAELGDLWREANALNMDRAQALARVVEVMSGADAS